MRKRRFTLVALLALLAVLAPAARALAAPGDPIVLGDDAQGPPFKAIYRVLPGGTSEKLSAANALPGSTAIAFTGQSSLVAVAGQAFTTFDLSTRQLVSHAAQGAVDMRGAAVAPDGSVIVSDFGSKGDATADGRVRRLNLANGETTLLSEGGLLVNPLGIAVGEDGTVYVTNSDGAGHGSVIAVDPATGAQRTVASSPMVAPWGIAFLPSGDLVVADESYNHAFRGALVRIDPATGAQTPLLLERLNGPIDGATGVAVDAAGEVVVTERGAGQVDRVNLQTGVAQQIATGIPSPLDVEPEPGVAPTTKLLSGPSGTTQDTTPAFTFEPSIYGAQSVCAIDKEAAVPCRRAFTTAPLTNGVHSFFVRSSLLGADGAQVVRNFTVDPSAPDTLIDSGPSGPTNDPTPTFTFEAPGGGTSFTCSLDGAAGVACSSPFTVGAALADGQHTFTVRADNDPVGDSRTFTVDTIPPDTAITSGPNEGAATNATQPTFTFTSTEDPATFKCTLDGFLVGCGAVFSPAAPLGEGPHILIVAARDAADNEDPTPVTRHFTVDTTPPVTTITAGPAGTTGDATPTFEFTASEVGVTFRCSVDGSALAICASPFTVSPALADGDHTFSVRATDPAGNVEVAPPVRDFTVAATVPETSITAGPSGLTNDNTPTFEFVSTKPGSHFTCALDGGAAAACDSPFTTGPLADGAHTFSVFATDALGHEDPTPATRDIVVDTVAPQTALGTGPGPLTNDRTPQFEFTSEPGASFACSLDGGPATPCASPFTAPPLADGAHTLRVTATDAAGNVEATPPRFEFTVDTAPPVTTITAGPTDPTGDATPTFEFTASEQASTFACSIDVAPFAGCASPFTVSPALTDGTHLFRVRATDAAGNVEVTAATRNFTVDTTPPDTSITAGPTGPTSDNTPTFEFSSTKPGSTFKCSIDGANPTACTSPFDNPALPDGPHTFSVFATDALGHEDPTPATRDFTVDTTPPLVTITAGPSGETADSTPTFEFRASEPGVTFFCEFDGSALRQCVSPFTLSPAVPDGPHSFRVQAVDAAGNADPIPRHREFVIFTDFPDTSITAGPGDLTKDNTPTFEFSSTKPGSTFRCSVDGAIPTTCASPFEPPALVDGPHTFAVSAVDGLGHADPSAASRAFTVDTTPPQTRIDAGPEGDTTDRRPTFRFSASEGATFLCQLDAGPSSACAGTFQPPADLALGQHTFTVLATDTAGNPDPTPAERTFRVVQKPEPPKEEHPPAATTLGLRATLKHRSLQIQATVSPAVSGTLEVLITAHSGHVHLKRHFQVTLTNGTATKKLLLPRAFPRVTLTAQYNGDDTHAPSSATKGVRARRARNR